MKKTTKIIIGIVILIPIIAIIGGIIWFEATTVSVDELKQEKALYDEEVENGTINNTTERDELEKEKESTINSILSKRQEISDAIVTEDERKQQQNS